MTTLALQNKISQTSTHSKKFNTLVMQYGDGYIQRVSEPINSEQESWSIVYTNLDATEYETLQTFIQSVEMFGVIEWAPIGDVGSPIPIKKWIIDPGSEINIVNKSGGIYDVNLTLKRVYDL